MKLFGIKFCVGITGREGWLATALSSAMTAKTNQGAGASRPSRPVIRPDIALTFNILHHKSRITNHASPSSFTVALRSTLFHSTAIPFKEAIVALIAT